MDPGVGSADGTHRDWIPVETSSFSARAADHFLSRHMESNFPISSGPSDVQVLAMRASEEFPHS